MLKYVAILNVDEPRMLGEWHSGRIDRYYKSPIMHKKEEAEAWIKNKLEELEKERQKENKRRAEERKTYRYPDININPRINDVEYSIRKTILAFNVEKSENVEEFISHLY